MEAKIIAICISNKKGTIKKEVSEAILEENHGIKGDAHAGNWHRQVSLLAVESVDKMRREDLELPAGVFAENILTEGIELFTLPVGTKIKFDENIIVEVTQIGKECHHGCEIRKITGDCVMPREGIFVKIIQGGKIYPGMKIEILEG